MAQGTVWIRDEPSVFVAENGKLRAMFELGGRPDGAWGTVFNKIGDRFDAWTAGDAVSSN